MQPTQLTDLQKKIVDGVNKAFADMIESKKKNNGKIVILKDGQIKTINAVDLKS